MKRILIFILAIIFCLTSITPAFSADELIYETFDNWKNPNVAEGWKTHSVGGWGGEFNQIYEAAQEMTTGPGEVVYYRSIYKDFAVEAGKEYSISYDYRGWGLWAWLQFYDEQNQLLLTVRGLTQSSYSLFMNQYIPNKTVRYVSQDTLVQTAVKAPSGAKRMRLVFQIYSGGVSLGNTVQVKNIILYEASNPTFIDQWMGTQYTYQKIGGPFINRNTEFSKGVNNQFGTYVFGYPTGEYNIKPLAGSSQGISAGGTFSSFKSLYRDLKVTPGQKYKLSVDVTSNSTNESGTKTPSPVRIWVQYNGLGYLLPPGSGYGEMVLSTHGIDGTQAGIKDNEWTTVTVPGPNGESYTTAPSGADHVRIILQVMGGTGGGTIFDNVSFTRYEN